MASQLAYVNNCAHIVRVIPSDIRGASLPEKVDIIVSEWMGSIGVDENMLGAVLWARDHFLKPGGVLIPGHVTAWAAPIATAQRPDTDFFLNRPYGLDLTLLAEPFVNELLMERRRVEPTDLAAPAHVLWKTDVASDQPSVVRHPFTADLKFAIPSDAQVSAIGAWFSAELAPGILLTNAPSAPDTHWGQLMLPLAALLELKAGDTLEVKLKAHAVNPGPLQLAWSARVNGGPWQHHDTMGAAHANLTPRTHEPPRSELSRFLAGLSVAPTLLSDFLADPDAVMASRGLSEEHRAALRSLNPAKIQKALYESEPS
jgi:hypothetical protein